MEAKYRLLICFFQIRVMCRLKEHNNLLDYIKTQVKYENNH